MKRLASLGAVLLLLPVAAQAHRQTVKDGKDSPTDVDIRSAKLKHTARTVTFTIRTWQTMPKGAEPCVDLKVGRREFYVHCYSTGIFELNTPNQQTHKIGFSRTSKTVTYVVKRKHFGNPKSFRWRAVFFENERPADAAPNKGYKKHSF